jgi:hypothetical protein
MQVMSAAKVAISAVNGIKRKGDAIIHLPFKRYAAYLLLNYKQFS